MQDGIRESQRRATRGLETLHNGINSLTCLARLNQIATDVKHDPMLLHGEADALHQAIDVLKTVVLPAMQDRVLDNCDDDTQGDFRGHEAQSKDDEFPTVKRRRRSHQRKTNSASSRMPNYLEHEDYSSDIVVRDAVGDVHDAVHKID